MGVTYMHTQRDMTTMIVHVGVVVVGSVGRSFIHSRTSSRQDVLCFFPAKSLTCLFTLMLCVTHTYTHTHTSRFMQFQPNLTHLGFARLKLFEIFCLSTIKAQTNQNFLWVIATDPDLQPALKEPLIRMLQNQTNIVLIPNNLNRGESIRWPGILRDDAGKKRRPVWSGDYDLLEQYHKASLTRPTIMTRLDADDGLALEYVDEIQTMVHNEYLNEPNVTDASFKIFCPQHHLEWHYTNPLWQDLLNDSNDNSDGGDDKKKEKAISASILKPKSRDIGLPPSKYGYPVYIKRPHATCMTAGLSVLIGPTTQREAFPTAHHLIAPTVPECADNDDSPWKDGQKKPGPVYAQTTKRINCWQRTFVKTPGAVRSRTPTSAGMSGVSIEGVAHEMRHLTNETALEEADPLRASRFDVLQTYFRIDRDMLARTKTHFRQHIPDVAADNLQGQCTTGHSCHKEAQQKLKALTRLK